MLRMGRWNEGKEYHLRSMPRPCEFRVISIGTLAAHPLWEERLDVRTGHATTTLITAGEANVLVDPSLPAAALVARLGERSRLGPDEITHVFLTSADFLHRRALEAFPSATWLANKPELAAAIAQTAAQLQEAETGGDAEFVRETEHQRTVLGRIDPASDVIVTGVDLFPLPGVSPGSCGLLLPLPRATVCICGDAIATVEHLKQGKVLPECYDVEQARASFAEVIEIADVLVLGRDNVVVNPLRG